MSIPDPRPVLAAYPLAAQPTAVHYLGGAGGYSGARFWRIETSQGPFCLRCWPPEYPQPADLHFIHAVLQHATQSGFPLAPGPLNSVSGDTCVHHSGHLWEMTPWLPGKPVSSNPTKKQLQAAMVCLAQFHQGVAEFPRKDPSCPRTGPSPGILKRSNLLRDWMAGRAEQLREATQRISDWPEICQRASRLLSILPQRAPGLADLLTQFSDVPVSLQPCIRDVWSDHVLFQGDEVTGLIDFGSMGIDNVSCDVARLLGSFAGDSVHLWKTGIEAYTDIRGLSDVELALVRAFDQSGVLLGALNWAAWVLLEDRGFENREAVADRMDLLMNRLESPGASPPPQRGLLL